LIQARNLTAELPLDSVKNEELRTNLRQVGLQLMFGKALRARSNANSIAWEIFHRGETRQREALAYALTLEAVSEATVGLDREALWHWSMAQTILPTLNSELLRSYGGIVRMFESSPMRDQHSARVWLDQQGLLPQIESDFTSTVLAQRTPFQIPRRKPGKINGQQVSVSYLVDPEGKTWTPFIEEGSPSSLAVFTVLESILYWQYEPAQTDGEAGWARVGSKYSFK
jgi:hypothetical protein